MKIDKNALPRIVWPKINRKNNIRSVEVDVLADIANKAVVIMQT